MNKPRVAIVYLCWGMVKYVHDVADAIAKQSYPKDRMKFFAVSAGSTDGIQDVVKRDILPRSGKDLPETVLLDDPVNRGFAGNNNVAIRQAIEEGFDYIFLHNGDLTLNPNAIEELVKVMEADKTIASAQSLVLYWDDHETVNVSGGVFHIAGYGYARDNLKKLRDMHYPEVDDVAYASGAALLMRTSALQEVGLMEEGFFMYHEDLELGLRFRIAGYRNVLASKSLAYHDYQFSRNPKKFMWMELYRWIVVKAYYRTPTLLLMTPLLLMIEAGTWVMAAKGGWLKAKFWQYGEFFKPRTWKLQWRMRFRAQGLRKVNDQDLLKFVSGTIEAQEQSNFVVERIANPVIELWVSFIRAIVIW